MKYGFRVALHDTDAAGVLFFGHLFRHLHDAYEDWMAQLGFPLHAILREGKILLPLTHAEADYRAPMRHGEQIRVTLALDQLSQTRFTLAYRCLTDADRLVATALTRHCCIDPVDHQPIPIPDPLAQALHARADGA
jgi:1,4-dihydroxy-2-naphthoyl-CoA hydrolase